MGIGAPGYELLKSLPLPSGYSVCELGSQEFLIDGQRGKASELYRMIGCRHYESIDGDGKGTITADLNYPLDPHPGQFDVVTDFGTSEHVFDFAQCWRTIHSLTKPGGLIVFDKPYQKWVGHCFYLTQKTLFRDMARANEFEIVTLYEDEHRHGPRWLGAFRKTNNLPWKNPNQGRYLRQLTVGEAS